MKEKKRKIGRKKKRKQRGGYHSDMNWWKGERYYLTTSLLRHKASRSQPACSSVADTPSDGRRRLLL